MRKTGPSPRRRRCQGRGHGQPLFLKSYFFAKDVFLELCFGGILQGIQNFFDPSIPIFMVLRLLEETFVRRKIESFHFCSFPQVKLSPRRKEITHFTQTAFSENQFFLTRKREDYGAAKLPKLVRILVTCFDKVHNLCNLNIFYFCFAVP